MLRSLIIIAALAGTLLTATPAAAAVTDEQRAPQSAQSDLIALINAYRSAINHRGAPSVILVKTVKGYGTSAEANQVGTPAKSPGAARSSMSPRAAAWRATPASAARRSGSTMTGTGCSTCSCATT